MAKCSSGRFPGLHGVGHSAQLRWTSCVVRVNVSARCLVCVCVCVFVREQFSLTIDLGSVKRRAEAGAHPCREPVHRMQWETGLNPKEVKMTGGHAPRHSRDHLRRATFLVAQTHRQGSTSPLSFAHFASVPGVPGFARPFNLAGSYQFLLPVILKWFPTSYEQDARSGINISNRPI